MFQIIKIKAISIRSLLWIITIIFLTFLITIIADIFINANTIFLLIQVVFVPLFSILVLFLFYDLFGTDHTIFLHTFYKGLVQRIFLIFLGMYSVVLLMLCLLIKLYYGNFNVLIAFSLLLSQILLFGSVSLIIFVIISDISMAIALMVLYVSAEIATFGTNRFLYHAFYFNLYEPVSVSSVINIFIINLIVGLISYRLCKTIVA